MIRPTSEQVLRLAAVVGLLALACMTWSLLDPRPIPIMVAMSVGLGLATPSLGIFAVVLILAARRAARAAPPPDTDGAGERPGEERDA